MNKSGAANVASQARSSHAAMVRGVKQAKIQLACAHDNAYDDDGLPHCSDCGGYGPWHGHAEFNRFPNGDFA